MKLKTSFKKLLKVPSSKKVMSFLKRKEVMLLLGLLLLSLLFTSYNKYRLIEGFESSPSSFNDDVASGKKLVWFYADWCGHCKKMKSAWDSAAEKVKGQMVKINLGNSEDKKQQEISKKYNIEGYPTIYLLNNGEIEEKYKGGRNSDDFESFCANKISHD